MHAIDFVGDDELPAGHDFMFVAVPDGGLIFYRESALSPTSLEDSWAAYRALRSDPPPPDGGVAAVVPLRHYSDLDHLRIAAGHPTQG